MKRWGLLHNSCSRCDFSAPANHTSEWIWSLHMCLNQRSIIAWGFKIQDSRCYQQHGCNYSLTMKGTLQSPCCFYTGLNESFPALHSGFHIEVDFIIASNISKLNTSTALFTLPTQWWQQYYARYSVGVNQNFFNWVSFCLTSPKITVWLSVFSVIHLADTFLTIFFPYKC